MYEWIDPWAEIAKLNAALPAAREEGVRQGRAQTEDAISASFQPDFRRAVLEESARVAEDLMQRVAPGRVRDKLGAAAEAYMHAKRVLDTLVHAALECTQLVVRADGGGARFQTVMTTRSDQQRAMSEAVRLMAESLMLPGSEIISPGRADELRRMREL